MQLGEKAHNNQLMENVYDVSVKPLNGIKGMYVNSLICVSKRN